MGTFRGANDEVKQNELFDMKTKGYFTNGTGSNLKLSAFGQNEFERLIANLPGKSQVLIRMMVGGNAEKSEAQIKGFMQQ